MNLSHRTNAELQVAGALNGGDEAENITLLDNGFWDDNEMDPKTCGTGGIFCPLGPWATCMSSILPPLPSSPMIELVVSFPAILSHPSLGHRIDLIMRYHIAPNQDRNNRLLFSGVLMRQNLIVSTGLSICLHSSLFLSFTLVKLIFSLECQPILSGYIHKKWGITGNGRQMDKGYRRR